MALSKKTTYGGITISNKAIASVVANAAMECYGVVGLTYKNSVHKTFYELLEKDYLSKGISVSGDHDSYSISIYLIIAYDVKITEVLREVQKKVKYDVEKQFDIKIKGVNVFAQSLKKVD